MSAPQGTDLWLRLGFGFVAILFIVSLPTWALGLILAMAFAVKVGIKYVREQDQDGDPPASSRSGSDDAR